jgi:hypothetical protein
MQGRLKRGKRPRISVSLDPEDYDWVHEFDSPSDSYTLSRIVHAARMAGLTLEGAMTGGVLENYRDWLKANRFRHVQETQKHWCLLAPGPSADRPCRYSAELYGLCR